MSLAGLGAGLLQVLNKIGIGTGADTGDPDDPNSQAPRGTRAASPAPAPADTAPPQPPPTRMTGAAAEKPPAPVTPTTTAGGVAPPPEQVVPGAAPAPAATAATAPVAAPAGVPPPGGMQDVPGYGSVRTAPTFPNGSPNAPRPGLGDGLFKTLTKLVPVALGGVIGGRGVASGMAQGEAKQQEQQQQRQEAAQARQATLASQVGAQRAAQEREISAENARAGLQRDRDTSADKRLQDTLNSRESEGDKNRGAPGKTVQEQAYASLVKGGMDPEAAGQEVMKWGKNQPQQSLSQMYAAAMQSGDKLQQQKLLKAQADFKRAGAPEPGNYMPVIDPDGNIIGGWNPKANHYVSAGSNPTLAAAVGTAPGSEQPSIPAKPAAGAASGNLSASVDKSWASEYLAKGKYTGPDDEALMERFFDVVKPSSGFRMSQPQIDMLTGARSWMESAEGRALHAKTGTWFAPDQRAQIVGTINSVADAKLAAAGGGRRLPTGGPQTLTNKVHASGGAGQTAPPRPANVPAGYQYNANGPKGAGWYRPQ